MKKSRKLFFKYCEVKSCGEKFNPKRNDTKKCPKCAKKVLALRRIERIDISIKDIISTYPELEKIHKDKLISLSKELEKEVNLLKKELGK